MNPSTKFDSDEPRRPAKHPDEGPWLERCSVLFEDLRRPARAMVARAYGKSLSDDEIDDVYSSAWTATLSALHNRGSEMSDAELRGYVLTAVASHASKELRRRSRKPTRLLTEAHERAVADNSQPLPDEQAIGSESKSIARDLLSSLPARRRAVMLLRYGWGLSPDEVCALVSGLSRRAYRKEVTRGVEQLVQRLEDLEAGDWCRSREPLLRDYLAGTADEATRLQVEQHMSHCRACADLAARLKDELNDFGGAVVLGAAAGLIAGTRFPVLERLSNLAQAAKDGVAVLVERAELAIGAVAMSGGSRGVGAVGAGVAAKLAAAGGAGKVALACLGAGVAATACLAAGVIPNVSLDDLRIRGDSSAKQKPVERTGPDPGAREPAEPRISAALTPAASAPEPRSPVGSVPGGPEPTSEPAPAQEVDPVPPASQPAPPEPISSLPEPAVPAPPPTSSGGAGSIAGEEFGP